MLGLDPDPAPAVAASRATPRRADGPPAERAAARSLAHCRAVIDAAGAAPASPSSRSSPASSASARPAGRRSRAVVEHARAAGPARARRRQARRHRRHRRRLRAGARRRDADAVRRRRRPRRRRVHRQPLHGRRHAAPFVAAARAARRGRCSCSCARRTRAPPTSQDLDARRRRDACGSASRGSSTARRARRRRVRAAPTSAPSSAPPRPSTSRALRELMPRAPFLLPGVGAQGGRVEDLAPAFAPGRAGGLVTASRSIVARARGDGGGAGRGGAGARPSACAPPPGRLGESGRPVRPTRAMRAPRRRTDARPARWRPAGAAWRCAVAVYAVVHNALAATAASSAGDRARRPRTTTPRAADRAARSASPRRDLHRQGRATCSSAIAEHDRRLAGDAPALNPELDAQALQHRPEAQAGAVSVRARARPRPAWPRSSLAARSSSPAAAPAGRRAGRSARPAAILVEPATGDVVFARNADAAPRRSPRRRS